MPNAPFEEGVDGALRIYLRVTPASSRNEVIGPWHGEDTLFGPETRLSIKVSAPPEKGKANAAVLKLIARHYGVSKSDVRLVAGETSRLKAVEIKTS